MALNMTILIRVALFDKEALVRTHTFKASKTSKKMHGIEEERGFSSVRSDFASLQMGVHKPKDLDSD